MSLSRSNYEFKPFKLFEVLPQFLTGGRCIGQEQAVDEEHVGDLMLAGEADDILREVSAVHDVDVREAVEEEAGQGVAEAVLQNEEASAF